MSHRRLNKDLPAPRTSRVMRCWFQSTAAADIPGQSTGDDSDATQLSAQHNIKKRTTQPSKEPRKRRAKDEPESKYLRERREAVLAAEQRVKLFDDTQAKCLDVSAFQPIDLSTIDPRGCIYERQAVIFNCLLAQIQAIWDPLAFLCGLDTLRSNKPQGKHPVLAITRALYVSAAGAGRRMPGLHTVLLENESERATSTIQCDDQVTTLLREGVEQPIVVLGKPAHYKPTINEFCRVYEDYIDLCGKPFKPWMERGTRKHSESKAEFVPVSEMRRVLTQPSREGVASSFSMLPNLTRECWTPSFIQQHDLQYRILIQRGEARDYRFDECALAGSNRSLAMPSVAELGSATWVMPVIGGQLWGFLAGKPEHRRRLYTWTDFDVTHDSYKQSFPGLKTHWINMTEDAKPVLILPPGEPQFAMGCGEHVCLYGRLYVKEWLHMTWRAIATELFDLGLKYRLYSPGEFDILTLIVNEHFGPMFNEHDRAASCPELGQLVARYDEWQKAPSCHLGGMQQDAETLRAVRRFMFTAANTIIQAGYGSDELEKVVKTEIYWWL